VTRRPLCANPELLVLLAKAEGWELLVPEQCESHASLRVLLAIRHRGQIRQRGRMAVHQADLCVWHAFVVVERNGGRILGELATASP
jgi:hypothetical protein